MQKLSPMASRAGAVAQDLKGGETGDMGLLDGSMALACQLASA